jgi:hypothetical protein
VRAPISGGSIEVSVDQERVLLSNALARAGHDGSRSHVDGGVGGQPAAVRDQQRGRHVRVVRQVVQVAVDHHGALRIAGEHHLGVGALRGERLELLRGRIGAVIDVSMKSSQPPGPTSNGTGARGIERLRR